MCRIGGLLPIFVILMAIAGHCSKSPVAPSFQAGARSAASGVEDARTAAFSPMKAHDEHQGGNARTGAAVTAWLAAHPAIEVISRDRAWRLCHRRNPWRS